MSIHNICFFMDKKNTCIMLIPPLIWSYDEFFIITSCIDMTKMLKDIKQHIIRISVVIRW